MTKCVLLDTGPLGQVIHPKGKGNREITKWLKRHLESGTEIKIPEISDYELRRKLLHLEYSKSIRRLDELCASLGYIPIDTSTMREAADLWARARHQGKPTADEKALDGDMILSAQASSLTQSGREVIIATGNIRHLQLFADARLWTDINIS